MELFTQGGDDPILEADDLFLFKKPDDKKHGNCKFNNGLKYEHYKLSYPNI